MSALPFSLPDSLSNAGAPFDDVVGPAGAQAEDSGLELIKQAIAKVESEARAVVARENRANAEAQAVAAATARADAERGAAQLAEQRTRADEEAAALAMRRAASERLALEE